MIISCVCQSVLLIFLCATFFLEFSWYKNGNSVMLIATLCIERKSNIIGPSDQIQLRTVSFTSSLYENSQELFGISWLYATCIYVYVVAVSMEEVNVARLRKR